MKSIEETEKNQEIENLKLRISENNLTLSDHLVYLRSPVVKQNFKSLIILLNSLFKKLLANEGCEGDDDIFR